MATTVVPQTVVVVLILAQSLVSDWLTHQKLPPVWNLLIVVVTIIAASCFCAWLAGDFQSTPTQIALNIIAYIGIMATVYFKPLLDTYLRPLPSPLLAIAPTPAPSSPTASATPATNTTPTVPLASIPPTAQQGPSPLMRISPLSLPQKPKNTMLPPDNKIDDTSEAHGG